MTAQPISAPRLSASTLVIAFLIGLAVLWSYWTTLATVALRWWEDPQYSHGFIVPVFAAYLLWLRRERLTGRTFTTNWFGLGLLGLAIGLRFYGAYFSYDYLDQISLVPCCAGLFLLAGGMSAILWAWPAIAFLAFMIPLPHKVSLAMSAPLQTVATTVSTFFLQVLGRPAIAEGNVILLNEVSLGIIEACSGLSMLVTFFALSVAVALVIHKPLWERCLIACSAVPIAICANILRITLTGLLSDSFGKEYGDYFHNGCGLAMMPIGLVFLGIEMWILRTLLIERSTDLAGAISMQRIDVSPVSLYRSSQTPRREKIVEPEPEPVAAE